MYFAREWVVQALVCSLGRINDVKISEKPHTRMALASKMQLECIGKRCTFFAEYATLPKIGKSYEVNSRVVFAGRNTGVGHGGLEKFAGVMNMPHQ